MTSELSDKYMTFLRKDHLLLFEDPLSINRRPAIVFTVVEVTKFFCLILRKI